MLVAVIMIFVVFSFTGVAVLDLSTTSSIAALETIDNIKLQYDVESAVNEALWLINTDADSLVNSDADGVTTVWDDATQVLTVTVDKYNMESEIQLDLSTDTHFDRGIAAEGTITLDGNDPGLSDVRQIRSNFQFMPEVDMDYFYAHAAEVHTETGSWWNYAEFEDMTLADGIHIFEGDYVTLDNITLNSGTIVFTGRHIRLRYENHITATPADSTGAYPALVFTDPAEAFTLYSPEASETIMGAIYCNNTITLQNGNVSGPILGHDVSLSADFNILDTENDQYYQWTHGFGDQNNYDWPKQIDRWTITKWVKGSTPA